MEKFEYEITAHFAEQFDKLVYFCSETGECRLEDVHSEQIHVLIFKNKLSPQITG